MLTPPPGVAWPVEPVLTVERPMRIPLRYTFITCSGMLTSTMSGPLGESCGLHQYSPGFSGPVGLPVGVPLVCADGFSTPCTVEIRTAKRARRRRSFMWWVREKANAADHQKASAKGIGLSSHAVSRADRASVT